MPGVLQVRIVSRIPLLPGRLFTVVLLLLAGLTSGIVSAQSVVEDYAVRVSAATQTNPPRITLSWPGDPSSLSYKVYRKSRDATSWGVAVNLGAQATNYADAGVGLGFGYEYRVVKTATNMALATNYVGEGYVYAGFGIPLVENRGKVVLLVDSTLAPELAPELATLIQDLTGDGWTVLRHDVNRTDAVPAIRTLIRNDYTADPARVKAVFLLGHVPVPYAGDYMPDGHTDHRGAWPADGYYGDMDGNWTDSTINRSTAADPRNRNVPGDGKFDQSLFPSPLELQVGRVDMVNMPGLGASEVELMRRYLKKNHAFRHRFFTLEPRGLIDDNFGVFGGEAFAVNGWRNFAALFGADNTIAGDWLTTLSTQGFLWGYGCGDGTYTSAGGVLSTDLLVTNDPRVAFTFLFGSYFGDWDSTHNLMRASLATPGYTLTCAWAGRPHWVVHHMALGETIGFCTRLTQNNSTLYAANGAARLVHIALLGDPTLRLHPVVPPTNLVSRADGLGGMVLTWTPSSDPVLGYAIYRAATAAGPFGRVNAQFTTSTNYTVTPGVAGVYMVRAVILQNSASGNYYNPSQGAFREFTGTVSPPRLTVQRANQTLRLSWPTNFAGYRLETTSLWPLGSWTPVPDPPQISNGQNVVTQPAQDPQRFYRLQSP